MEDQPGTNIRHITEAEIKAAEEDTSISWRERYYRQGAIMRLKEWSITSMMEHPSCYDLELLTEDGEVITVTLAKTTKEEPNHG